MKNMESSGYGIPDDEDADLCTEYVEESEMKNERAMKDVDPIDLLIIASKEQVDHPDHYGGKDNPYETIKVIDAWGLDFCLGNAIKYISRAGKKDDNSKLQDLKKALWYIQHEIVKMEGKE